MGPAPGSDGVGETCSNGVLDDVAAYGAEVTLVVDHARCETAGEERSEAAVPSVERLRVTAEELLEPAGELGLGALDDEVVVRRHEAQRVHRPAEPRGAVVQEHEEEPAIAVVAEDRASGDSTRHDVEVAVGKAAAQNARHVLRCS